LQLPVLQLKQLHSLELTRLKMCLPTQPVTTGSSAFRASINGGSSPTCGSPAAASSGTVLLQLQKLKLSACRVSVDLIPLLSSSTLSAVHWKYVKLYSGDFTERLTRGQVLSTMWQRLQLLPNVTELQLQDDSLTAEDIAPLSNLQHLQHLNMRLSYSILSGQHTASDSQLLAALEQLTNLRHLELTNCQLDHGRLQWQSDSYQSFSALTASTQLTALILAEQRGLPVPMAGFDKMFAPGRELPSLKVVHLVSDSRLQLQPPSGHIGPAQVARIAASCPALQELALHAVTLPGFDASCLLQLPPTVTSVEGLEWVRPASESL
jgi:hypothetical protein